MDDENQNDTSIDYLEPNHANGVLNSDDSESEESSGNKIKVQYDEEVSRDEIRK